MSNVKSTHVQMATKTAIYIEIEISRLARHKPTLKSNLNTKNQTTKGEFYFQSLFQYHQLQQKS